MAKEIKKEITKLNNEMKDNLNEKLILNYGMSKAWEISSNIINGINEALNRGVSEDIRQSMRRLFP